MRTLKNAPHSSTVKKVDVPLIRFIKESYAGNRPLWQAFWLIGMCGCIVLDLCIRLLLFIFFLLCGQIVFDSGINSFHYGKINALLLLWPILVILYFAVSLPSVWRCGTRSKIYWRISSMFFMASLIIYNVHGLYSAWTYLIPFVNVIKEKNGF